MSRGGIRKVAGTMLMLVGVMFIFLRLSDIIPNLLAGTVSRELADTRLWSNPVHVLDLGFVLPGMILTAALLWQRRALGYLLAAPLLIFCSTLGLGIIAMMLLSAVRGLPYAIPPLVMVGAVVTVSAVVAILFLREVDRDKSR